MPGSAAIGQKIDSSAQPSPLRQSCTFICSRDTLDGAYPSLILAINSRRLGMDASVFYTFMGINVIRKAGAAKCKFVPGGAMGAIPGISAFASWMMRKKIGAAGIPALDELMEMAQLEGVGLIACKMTIDMMGLRPEDFIEGVEIQTAEEYLKHARQCDINMFT
ncbi:MAG: DsrE/DsrF/DrsH-like family protein [Syntrophobacteraceae bacterium]|jgi:peroxiredoxin family protein